MMEDEGTRRNFAVLLGQGVSGGAANELTSVQLVLPFLYTTAGAPVFFAGLLVPVSTVAKRIAQIRAAPLVGAARSNKRLIFIATLSVALAIVLISLTNSISGLNAFVIATNIGLIIGGLLWASVGKRSIDTILLLAASLTCIGGLLAMAIELRLVRQNIFCYAIVFVLVSLGAQGTKNGRTLYLLGMTTDEERPFCIAVANVTIGMVAIAFGALLGALASLKGVSWVILALVILNVLAAIYTLRLRGARSA
jgi:hypothetical protein